MEPRIIAAASDGRSLLPARVSSSALLRFVPALVAATGLLTAMVVALHVRDLVTSGSPDPVGVVGGAAGQVIAFGAVVVVWRRAPRHPLLWWFAVGSAAGMLDAVLAMLVPQDVVAELRGWSAIATSVAIDTIALLGSIAVACGLATFPGGMIRTRGERVLVRASPWLLLLPVALAPFVAVVPLRWYAVPAMTPPSNPAFVGMDLGLATAQRLIVLGFSVTLVGVVLLALRYRRLDAAGRQGVRWLALPVVVLGVVLVGNLLFAERISGLLQVALIAVPPLLSVSFALGMVGRGSGVVDRVLRRWLVFGALWLAIVAAYVLLGTAIGLTADSRLPTEPAIMITIVATLLFQPARVRLERLADRWVFGRRADPARTVTRLGESLAAGLDLGEVLPRMERVLVDGLGLAWARVRLVERDGTSQPPREPDGPEEPVLSVDIVHQDEVVGVVECGPRRTGGLDDQDRAVIRTLARQAGLAVGNVRLAAELRERADQLAASRARLVRAQETERRRIERNIHDGVQQDIVGLLAQVGRLRRGERADGTKLDVVQDGLARLLSDVRDLAAGIHPSVLTDLGLVPSVEELASRHPLRVRVRTEESLRRARFDDEVEAVAYFTIAEALANIAKHASADCVEVRLSCVDGQLCLAVEDDGRGFATSGPGAPAHRGLESLAERLSAAGGDLRVTSRPGRGTSVTATIAVGVGGAA